MSEQIIIYWIKGRSGGITWFNSAQEAAEYISREQEVSIHAPARGATMKSGEPATISWEGMPDDARPIAAFVEGRDYLTVCIVVESETFPEVPEGDKLETFEPRATRHYPGQYSY